MLNIFKRNKKLTEKKINEIRQKCHLATEETKNTFKFAEDLQDNSIRQMHRRHSKMDNKSLTNKKNELVDSIVLRSGDMVLLHAFLEHNQDMGRRYNKFVNQIFPPLKNKSKKDGTDEQSKNE